MADFNIWEGVFSHYDDVPKKGDGFSSDFWKERNRSRVVAALNQVRSDEYPEIAKFREYVLTIVIAMHMPPKGIVRILDFGGGIGNSYIPLMSNIIDLDRVEFHIIDNDKLCNEGIELFKGGPSPIFHSELPNNDSEFDIVHIGSVLPYICDWRSMIARLSEYKPRHILFSDFMAGNIPTFATMQNSFGDTIPHWFFNVDEVISFVEGLGMKLLFKAPYVGRFLGQEGPLPMDNFDPVYRLEHACHLLFGRS